MTEITLEGRAVIITGASRGIGRATAEAFGSAGARLLLNYVHDDEAAESLEKTLADRGVDVMLSKGSVADPALAETMARRCLDKWGRIDGLINNAGVCRDIYFGFMKEEDWQHVLSVNLDSLFYCSKAVVNAMIAARAGFIINISSVSAVAGQEGQVNYAAAKAGVLGFTRALAREVGRYNVRVNAIVAGLVDTDMTKRLPRKLLAPLLSQTSLKRMARPAEIASVALFLASDLASFVTGSCIQVDGGL